MVGESQTGATCCASLEAGDASLTIGGALEVGAAGDDGENQGGWRFMGSYAVLPAHQKHHWSPLRPRC